MPKNVSRSIHVSRPKCRETDIAVGISTPGNSACHLTISCHGTYLFTSADWLYKPRGFSYPYLDPDLSSKRSMVTMVTSIDILIATMSLPYHAYCGEHPEGADDRDQLRCGEEPSNLRDCVDVTRREMDDLGNEVNELGEQLKVFKEGLKEFKEDVRQLNMDLEMFKDVMKEFRDTMKSVSDDSGTYRIRLCNRRH